jgi:peptidoglycan/xylan/chitin deacetylase (PgdA/CDA1 family)
MTFATGAAAVKAYVLTYHSHRILGDDYARNDHVSLRSDLETITAAGCTIVPLDAIVKLVQTRDQPDSRERFVALTFDDGPAFDLDDVVHPDLGLQRSFANIMRDFRASRGGGAQPRLHGTSFVIASPDARLEMEQTYEREYSYIAPGALSDAWWQRAIDGGLISIANHSWDHLHPGIRRVAHSQQARGDFARVSTFGDADAQILAAMRYIDARTSHRAAPYFAYPYGTFNEFLTERYLPARQRELGLVAAFTTEPGPIVGGENVWCLPRYVCGHHWKAPHELAGILAD